MGINVEYPFVISVDNSQARSFQGDTCPNSKIRGSIDMREAWVQEMRDEGVVKTVKIATKFNFADLMTKPMAAKGFKYMLDLFVEMQDGRFRGDGP